MTRAAEPLCRLSDLRKAFDSHDVIAGVSLDVMPGDVVALVGGNGAGKSTLLRLVAGLARGDNGDVYISQERVIASTDQPHIRRQLAYVADQPALFEDLTIRQQASFVGRAWGMSEWEDRMSALAIRLQLNHRLDDQASQLSKGMRQKAGLLLAFLHPSAVMLLDEPFSGLDAAGRDYLAEYLSLVHSSNTCAIVSTHALDRVKEFANRAVRLDAGVLTEVSLDAAESMQKQR